MTLLVMYLAFALYHAAMLAAAVYLVMHGHPWFALVVLLVGSGAKFKASGTPEGQ